MYKRLVPIELISSQLPTETIATPAGKSKYTFDFQINIIFAGNGGTIILTGCSQYSDRSHVPTCRQYMFGFAPIYSQANISRPVFNCTKDSCNITIGMINTNTCCSLSVDLVLVGLFQDLKQYEHLVYGGYNQWFSYWLQTLSQYSRKDPLYVIRWRLIPFCLYFKTEQRILRS